MLEENQDRLICDDCDLTSKYKTERLNAESSKKGHCFLCNNESLLSNKLLMSEEELKIINLLDEEEKQKSYLDLGFSEKENVFWYGFNLNAKEAILLSNGKILRNTLEKIRTTDGLSYVGKNEILEIFEYDGYIGNIAPVISKDTLKKFYANNHNSTNPKEIYKKIKSIILHYMDFGDNEEIADVFACWIMSTYCYPIFYWFPHILINAPSGSGKSKCGYIVMSLSFRGFDLGASAGVTPAQLFRTLEGNRGTLLIDEFENRKGEIATDTQQLVYQIINASASRDAYVIRTEQINKKWKATKFPIFCPKIICNISGMNPTSLSRCIASKWQKTDNKEKSSRHPSREKDKKILFDISQEIYIFMLKNWINIKILYESMNLEKLQNRDYDNWLPLFAIARFIDSCDGENLEIEKKLLKYLEDYNELQIETDDPTLEFFKILSEKIQENKFYMPKEIAGIEEIAELLSYYKSPAHWIGKKLKLFGFKTNKRAGGVQKYWISKESLEKINKTYGSINIITQNSTNNTQEHKQHENTQDVSFCAVSVIIPESIKVEKVTNEPE